MEDDILDLHTAKMEGLLLNSTSKTYLGIAAKWAKFLSIVGFVFIGIMVFMGIGTASFLSSTFENNPTMSDSFGKIGGVGFGLLYIVFSIIAGYPVLRLYQFAKFGKIAASSDDNIAVEASLKGLSGFFKFYGYMMMVLIAIYIVVILGIIIVGIAN